MFVCSTVKRWYKEFNRGRHSLGAERSKGCSKSVVVSENINAAQKLITEVCHVGRELEGMESAKCEDSIL